MTTRRIIIDILLIVGAFIAPWWLVCLATVVCLFVFESFYEIFAVALSIDVLYGMPMRFVPVPLLFTFFATLCFLGGMFLKKHIR